MSDNYCDTKFFGKVGDKNGFHSNKVLVTDSNSDLFLDDAQNVFSSIQQIDGGSSISNYLSSQIFSGGDANGN